MVVGQLEAVAVPGEAHEDVDRLVADRHPPALLEAERLVELHGPIDVADPVAGVDELRHRDCRLPGYRGPHDPRALDAPGLAVEHLPRRRRAGLRRLLRRRGRAGRAADRRGRGARHRRSPTSCSRTTTTTTSPSSSALTRRWPDAQVLIHPDERGLVPGATGDLRPGDELEIGGLSVEALHTPGPHARDALAAGRRHRRVHRRHAVSQLGRRRARARAHHLRRPQALDHGRAAGAAAGDDDPARPHRPHHRRRGVGRQRVRARLARPGSGGLGAVHRARRAGDADPARRRLRRRPQGVDPLARRLATTSCRGHRSNARAEAALASVEWREARGPLDHDAADRRRVERDRGVRRADDLASAAPCLRGRDDAGHRRARL